MTRPKLTREELDVHIPDLQGLLKTHPVIICGIRGYYKNSMGKAGENDLNLYDDAIFLVTPKYFEAFNGNTDPSKHQPSVATLMHGTYFAHKFDYHHGSKGSYPAICQRLGEVIVTRDGKNGFFKGWFGINIHMGGHTTTSSLGCQTIHPDQYWSFYNQAKAQAVKYYGEKWDKEVIPYILIEN